jgi:hypothetical protein
MPIFTLDQLRAFAASYATLQERLDVIATAYASFPYKTLPGRQYATRGFLRRFSTMHHCIERVFEMLPPEREERPVDAVLLDTAVYIQSFVMNEFGAVDNLAWIWVSENSLKIGRTDIGLGPKCTSVRASLSQETRDYLAGLDDWFAHITDFRDALAHRIPLYIPPFIVSEEDDPAYEALEVRKLETNDSDEYDQLSAEQAKLRPNAQPDASRLQRLQTFRTIALAAAVPVSGQEASSAPLSVRHCRMPPSSPKALRKGADRKSRL